MDFESATSQAARGRALVSVSLEDAMFHLDRIARGYGRSTEAQTKVRGLFGEISELSIEDVFDEGLHEFLTRMIGETAALSDIVHEVYLSGEAR